MSDTLSFAEIDGQHVELLPARTVLSLFSIGGSGDGGGYGDGDHGGGDHGGESEGGNGGTGGAGGASWGGIGANL